MVLLQTLNAVLDDTACLASAIPRGALQAQGSAPSDARLMGGGASPL